LDSVSRELAAPYRLRLGETSGSNIHRSTNDRACAGEFAATGSRGVDRSVSNRGRTRCATHDWHCGQAWLRHGASRQLSALGGVSHSYHDFAASRRGGWVYGHNIWVSPAKVLAVIAKLQFVPLLIGAALMYFALVFSIKIRRTLNAIGNTLLMLTLIVLLVKMGADAKGGQSVGSHCSAAARSWLHCCGFCHPYRCNSDD
jgi:hypothetical protein